MHAFVQEPSQRHQRAPSKTSSSGVMFLATSHLDHPPMPALQRTIGNQAEHLQLKAKPDDLDAASDPAVIGRLGHDFTRTPVHAAKSSERIQPKLAINTPGDIYEQEADRVSDRLMRMSGPEVSAAVPLYQNMGKCIACDRPGQTLQTKQDGLPETNAGDAPGIVHEVLRSPGQPLDAATRAFMEPRFGRDFSRVRVHADLPASDAARSVAARAFTSGEHIVFGESQYAPNIAAGRHLLGHELVHVVQQTTAPAASFHLQRAPDKKQKRQDVVLLGEDMTNGEELAHLLSPGGRIFRVKNVGEVAAVLAKIDFPIGTLYFVAHSAPNGAVQFGSKEGVIDPADIASKLKSKVSADNAPEAVDFRGCSVGSSPKAMNQISAALGAKSVVAGTCFSIIDRSTPILIGDKDPKPVTKKSDVTDKNRPTFEKLLKSTADKFGEKKKCILNRSEDGFFAAGGQFVLLWFNPTESTEWIPGKSVCYNEINPETVDPNKALSESQNCRLIKVETKSKSKD